MVSSWQLFLALGQVLGAGVAQGTKDYTSTFSWRFPIALNIGICLIVSDSCDPLLPAQQAHPFPLFPPSFLSQQSSIRSSSVSSSSPSPLDGSSPRTVSKMPPTLSVESTKARTATTPTERSKCSSTPKPPRPRSPEESLDGLICSRVLRGRSSLELSESCAASRSTEFSLCSRTELSFLTRSVLRTLS